MSKKDNLLTPITKKPHRTNHTEDEIAEAIKTTGGVLMQMLVVLQLNNYTSLSNRIKNSPYLSEVMRTEKENLKDIAENTIVTAMKNGDVQAAKFYLTKKARDRGYGDAVAVSGKIEHTNYDLSQLSEEELDELERIQNRITIDAVNVASVDGD